MGRVNATMMALAIEAASRAGAVLRAGFGRALEVHEKGRADFVTDADTRAEAAIRDLLAREVPDHALLLEEGGQGGGRDPEHEWVVDPLDGTTNFIHGIPHFCVSVALRRKGVPVVGVVHDPLRGETFTAEAGRPSLLNGSPIAVSRRAPLRQALLCTGFPYRSRHHVDAYLACFRDLLLGATDLRRDGSAALDLAYVAAGRFEVFWEIGLKPWDTAAGSLIVEQAGGRVSDFHGGGDAVEGGDIVASNGLVHEEVVALTRRHFPARPR